MASDEGAVLGISYRFDDEHRLGLVVWVGEVTADAWREHVARLMTDPTVETAQRFLGDIRRWRTDESIDEGVIRDIASIWGASGLVTGKSVGIVAEGGFWDARTFDDALAPYGGNVIVFNDLSTACIWLGIDPVGIGERVTEIVAELREAGDP